LASLEAVWHTVPAPAGIAVVGFPRVEDGTTHFEVKAASVIGLTARRSRTGEVAGIVGLVALGEDRIEEGIQAYDAVERLKLDQKNVAARARFEDAKADLGYAMLLKRFVADPRDATPEQIQQAAWSTVPNVPVMFWVFRVMAGLGFFFIAFFAVTS